VSLSGFATSNGDPRRRNERRPLNPLTKEISLYWRGECLAKDIREEVFFIHYSTS
jgi:hypothetical protein